MRLLMFVFVTNAVAILLFWGTSGCGGGGGNTASVISSLSNFGGEYRLRDDDCQSGEVFHDFVIDDDGGIDINTGVVVNEGTGYPYLRTVNDERVGGRTSIDIPTLGCIAVLVDDDDMPEHSTIDVQAGDLLASCYDSDEEPCTLSYIRLSID